MSEDDPVIELIRLSKREFPEGVRDVRERLETRKKQKHPSYWFKRKKLWLPIGSKIVFSIKNCVVGEAKTVRETKRRPDDETYTGTVGLDPRSIVIYPLNPVIPESIKSRLFRRLTEKEYDRIRSQTEIQPSPGEQEKTSRARQRYEVGEDSKVHRQLEKVLRQHPETIEQGLQFVRAEYPFPTGDEIDVLLKDSTGRFVTVEIEPVVGKGDIVGLLQALKYRCMFAALHNLDDGRVRGLLVATRIHNSIRRQCCKYGIEAKEVRTTR